MSDLHPLIALWCHPRSMSTAFERVMRERGDCECHHEPFMYDYYVHRAIRSMPHFDPDDSRCKSYDEICEDLASNSQQRTVFFKDMSYYVVPRLFENPDFALRITNLFLIRNPHRSIMSYHKLDPEVTVDEIGIESQLQHVTWLCKQTGEAPLVIQAEQIQQNPAAVLNQVFSTCGLSPADHVHQWQSNVPDQWLEVSGWHQDVINSQGIRPPRPEHQVDEEFRQYSSEHPHLQHYLERHLPAYLKLKALSETQFQN